jgi:phosphonate transport system permease protein
MMKTDKNTFKKSLVPPFLASILTAICPGLGQFLAREYRRGLLLLLSFVSIGGLLVWRIALAGRRYDVLSEKISKAYYLQPMLIVITALFAIIYIWIIADAYLVAKKRNAGQKPRGAAILFFSLVIFFALGWQIAGIDPVTFFSRLDEAYPVFSKVMWPWDRAITYPEEYSVTKAMVQSPCTDETYPEAVPVEGRPYLHVTPTCGSPSVVEGEQGTKFTLTGNGFGTEHEVEIWWRDPINNEFRQRQEGKYVAVMPDANGDFQIDIIMPYRVIPPVAGEGALIWEVQARQLTFVGEAEISSELKLTIEKMIETIFIGMMATFFGIILALPFSFLAAKNLMGVNFITKAIYFIVRTIMNVVRSIEPLIWAIIAVIVVGLGPFAGIIALTVHSMAALAKMYSEAIENIDPGPIEAVQATGANWVQTIVYAVIPQIIPPFVSFTIYRWDINIRMSTVIGFVGGGGIGFLLQQWIRLLDYRSAGMAVWFITLTVMVLDYVSADVREKYT